VASDFYQELGVSRGASQDDIRRAYRKLAARYHPDKNPGNEQAETKFKAINRAHEALSNPKKRALYDQFGEVGLREGFNPDMFRGGGRRAGGRGFGGGLEDLFGGNLGGIGDLFGDVFQRRGAAKGQDAVAEVEVDFLSALRGANVKMSIAGVPGEVTVRVPPGANDGDRVRVPAQGALGRNGGPPGDLVLSIRVLPHEHFRRNGLDLEVDVPISVGEAYHGGKVRVPTPHGDVTLKIPARAKSGQLARLKAKGVKRKDVVGDLFVRFMIQLPNVEDPNIEKAIDTLAEATDLSERDKLQF
jgi:curved DNA-binding protein